MEPGLDGGLAAHAAASAPIYAMAFMFAKRLEIVNPRVEIAIALAVTILLNIGFEVARLGAVGTTEAILPLLSSCTTGAMAAMMLHALLFKQKEPAE